MNSERPTNGIDTPDDDAEFRALLTPFAGVLGSAAVWADPPAELESLDRRADPGVVGRLGGVRSRRCARSVRAADCGPCRRRRRLPRCWRSAPGCSSPAASDDDDVVGRRRRRPGRHGPRARCASERRRRRPRCRVRDPARHGRAAAGGRRRVLRGVASRRRRRDGERRHVPHAQRRQRRRAVVGRADRRVPHADRHRGAWSDPAPRHPIASCSKARSSAGRRTTDGDADGAVAVFPNRA